MCVTFVDLFQCKHDVLSKIIICKEWADGTWIDPRRFPLAPNPHFERELVTPKAGMCKPCTIKAAAAKDEPYRLQMVEKIKQAVAEAKARDENLERIAELEQQVEQYKAREQHFRDWIEAERSKKQVHSQKFIPIADQPSGQGSNVVQVRIARIINMHCVLTYEL